MQHEYSLLLGRYVCAHGVLLRPGEVWWCGVTRRTERARALLPDSIRTQFMHRPTPPSSSLQGLSDHAVC